MGAKQTTNEIRIVRTYDAPVRAVWDAWTIPEQVEQWWGPRGFTLTTHHRDVRVGGTWRYTMHGPDGTDYPNVTTYHVVEPYKALVYDHGATDKTPPLFRVRATFTESKNGTILEIVMTLATVEAAKQTASFIKKAGGNATWDRLGEHLEHASSGKTVFVINRSFEAPIHHVFDMWVTPAHLANWLPPAGSRMEFIRADITPGKTALFVISGVHGVMHARLEYQVVDRPNRIVYLQQFVDENEAPAKAPGADTWPAKLKTSVVFAEESKTSTRVTVTTETHGDVSANEMAAFVGERTGMTAGWTGSFDALEARLDSTPR